MNPIGSVWFTVDEYVEATLAHQPSWISSAMGSILLSGLLAQQNLLASPQRRKDKATRGEINDLCSTLNFHNSRLCGLAVRHLLKDREVRGSIPGRVKTKDLKISISS
ncbi:hypothetical protein ElyMa_000638900 [Elysia marginata]|uniref:Uncharacterized protein n=1 Tax=Elysia marginata TaxID=1093978 RepID=A0AAV4GBF9_9GAST|nr:hypothetical protein ElyMa_000638900 [Elysia marginata]